MLNQIKTKMNEYANDVTNAANIAYNAGDDDIVSPVALRWARGNYTDIKELYEQITELGDMDNEEIRIEFSWIESRRKSEKFWIAEAREAIARGDIETALLHLAD